MTATRTPSPTRRRKVTALLVAGLVAGVGVTSTLAVWNDSEWISGGIDSNADGIPDAPGVGTSTFEVQQNVSAPFLTSAWVDRETNPGGGLTFTTGALSLSPGSATYAPVSLRTSPTSIAAQAVALRGAGASTGVTVNDPAGTLFSALRLRVVVAETTAAAAPATCSAASFSAGATYVVGSSSTPAALDAAGTATQTLALAAGDKQDYCFEVSLPTGAASTLQGRTVAPAWEFFAASN
jgi:predicted ribosomally synthesized peptide with SipW-like signal peptide